MSKEKLFEGTPELFGGLSNETELYPLCPDEFKQNNPWTEYASRLFFAGGNLSNWKWKSTDKKEQNHQKACFKRLLSGFGLKHEHKEAIAGWMLSEMLIEVPKWFPSTKK